MKLYKYRDLSNPKDSSLERVLDILSQNVFWCANPSTLNDETEFIWECDYRASSITVDLLTEVLLKETKNSRAEARKKATRAIETSRLSFLATPILKDMSRHCREEIGLACFATSNDNEIMWERYGGKSNGVCIEIDAPDYLLGEHLFKVEYTPRKLLSIDQLLAAHLDPKQVRAVYSLALLSKPLFWAPEEEIRFVSKAQNIAVRIVDSTISGIKFGRNLPSWVQQKIKSAVRL